MGDSTTMETSIRGVESNDTGNLTVSDNSARLRKSEEKPPLIGLTKEELEVARQQPEWKIIRFSCLVLYWLIYAGFLAGAITLIVLKSGDVPSSTTTSKPSLTSPAHSSQN